VVLVLQVTLSHGGVPKNSANFFGDVITQYDSIYPVFAIQTSICEEETWSFKAPRTILCYQNFEEVANQLQSLSRINQVDLLVLVGVDSWSLLEKLEKAGTIFTNCVR
jgi:hypothetical protein